MYGSLSPVRQNSRGARSRAAANHQRASLGEREPIMSDRISLHCALAFTPHLHTPHTVLTTTLTSFLETSSSTGLMHSFLTLCTP